MIESSGGLRETEGLGAIPGRAGVARPAGCSSREWPTVLKIPGVGRLRLDLPAPIDALLETALANHMARRESPGHSRALVHRCRGLGTARSE